MGPFQFSQWHIPTQKVLGYPLETIVAPKCIDNRSFCSSVSNLFLRFIKRLDLNILTLILIPRTQNSKPEVAFLAHVHCTSLYFPYCKLQRKAYDQQKQTMCSTINLINLFMLLLLLLICRIKIFVLVKQDWTLAKTHWQAMMTNVFFGLVCLYSILLVSCQGYACNWV